VAGFAQDYASFALLGREDRLAGGMLMGWFGSWPWYIAFGLVSTFLLLLFPDGRLPARHWRVVAWVAAVDIAVQSFWAAFAPRPFEGPPGMPHLGGTQPDRLEPAADRHGAARLHHAQPVGDPGGDRDRDPPLHLYDIDQIINRTVVYGLLTILLGAVHAAAVLVLSQLFGGIGAELPSWAVAGATLAVATLFQPARQRIQHDVDQRFNRRRYDAAETIEGFSRRLRDEIDLDTLTAELLAVVNQSIKPTSASLWLRPSGDRAEPARQPARPPWA
jgi:hypothetical protein